MKAFQTQRYKILFEEISKGGPAGYESVYLHSEADPATVELYEQLNSLDGRFLASENKIIRQRNGSQLVQALREGKSLGIASGFKPSGAYHFGHKLTSSAVSFFQKNGVQIFMPVADIECDMDTKISKEDYLFWAADNLIDWGANGVNLDAAHVYLQSEEDRVFNLAYLLARGLTFDLAVDIYGFEKLCGDPKKEKDKGEFPFLFAGITQVGDIIVPQHKDFGNYHSFMVSGQDQDGHMKMTVELSKRAFETGIELPGIQTIPSGFYIPHIRGFKAKEKGKEPKMASSWPEGTLYLGSGPEFQTIEERIESSLKKLDLAYSDTENRENVKKCCLDLVNYIDVFNEPNSVNFGEVVEIVHNFLKDALIEHQKKRNIVLNYAIQRADYRDPGAWSLDDTKPIQPSFWKVPEKSIVDESKRNPTQWFNIVAKMRDKIIP